MTHPILYPHRVDADGIEWPNTPHPGHTWEPHAKCLGDNPTKWDYPRNSTMLGKSHVAAAACHGCTVVRQCAQAAIAEQSREIIRAGIPIPGYSGDIRAAIQQLSVRAGIHHQQHQEAAA